MHAWLCMYDMPPFTAPPKPTVCSESDETRNEGETVILRPCEFTSPVQLSDLLFQWSKDGDTVETILGQRFMINHDGFLTISEVQTSDSGLYRVTISNSLGSAWHTVRLLVEPSEY